MSPTATVAVWGDSPLANDDMCVHLRALGRRAEIADPAQTGGAHHLVALRRRPLTASESVAWLRLANSARNDFLIATREVLDDDGELPFGYVASWTGELQDLRRVAVWIDDLLDSLQTVTAPAVPTVFTPGRGALPAEECAASAEELVRVLTTGTTRLIPARSTLLHELRRRSPAAGHQEHALRTVLDWSMYHHRRTVVDLQLQIHGWGVKAYKSHGRHSLYQVVNDPRCTSLITLVGDPGAGKTLLLRQLNAQSAIAQLCFPGDDRLLRTFYVPLFEHPHDAPISLDWVEDSWNSVIDAKGWCTFGDFLAGGGAVILDGYNEVGAHPQPVTEWMQQWQAVIAKCLAGGARQVIVSCRTRDQLLPLRRARGEEPTAITLSPLTPDQIVMIASRHDIAAGRSIKAAITADAELGTFYATPFRLRTYVDSRASVIARTDARLFGMAIVAAILRERDQLHAHEALLPGREVAALVAAAGRVDEDPWPLLAEIPLIRILAALARAMSLPESRLDSVVTMIDRLRARSAIVRGLDDEHISTVSPIDVLGTAIDLHILTEDARHYLGFSHRTVRQLLATMTVDTGVLIRTLNALQGDDPARPSDDRMPGGSTGSAEVDSEVADLAVAAAQLRGDGFTRELARTDPVLAARAHVAARFDTDSAVAQHICLALHAQLAEVTSVPRSIAVLKALSLMGWTYPEPTPDNLSGAMHRIPAREWHLGMNIESGDGDIDKIRNDVSSERRSVELRAFWIADSPVTNAEYAGFVDAGGYERQEFWTVAGWDWRTRRGATDQFVTNWARKRDALRRNPDRIVRLLREGLASPSQAAALVRFIELDERDFAAYARRNQEQPVTAPMFWDAVRPSMRLNPVVGVSWYEANAFCAWKTQRIGRMVRLPTENEWEAACVLRLERGPVGHSINSTEHGAGSTTPVGAFDVTGGRERTGPKDLMGNCFEWTFDYYEPGEHVRKILKGGSWRQERWRAHPAYRGRGDANIRTDDIGFRYVIRDPDG